MGDDLKEIGTIILGLVGGFILLDILSNKCKNCGNIIPPFEKRCPHCGVEK
ncbi:hypothetical protein K0A97_03160 [Patescibacteria group bacterium]|nr:hypothetical protein [Patescibacteria group bacterium]